MVHTIYFVTPRLSYTTRSTMITARFTCLCTVCSLRHQPLCYKYMNSVGQYTCSQVTAATLSSRFQCRHIMQASVTLYFLAASPPPLGNTASAALFGDRPATEASYSPAVAIPLEALHTQTRHLLLPRMTAINRA